MKKIIFYKLFFILGFCFLQIIFENIIQRSAFMFIYLKKKKTLTYNSVKQKTDRIELELTTQFD